MAPMLVRLIATLARLCIRAAPVVVIAGLLAAALCAVYAAGHLNIDTDTDKLISRDLPWRKRAAEFDRAFPQTVDLLAVVIDGATPGQAEDAAAALASWAQTQPDLFKTVQRPGGGAFFQRNGLLFLSVAELQDVADQLISAQPLLGAIAADPSLRGLFSAIGLASDGVAHGDIKASALDAPLNLLADTVGAALAGHPYHMSWESLLTGRTPQRQELRRFVLLQPVLDYSALQPGERPRLAVKEAAQRLGFTADSGVRVRLTGSIALSDEEFATLAQGAGGATLASLALVCAILFLALRSWRIIVAILVTLASGLALTAGFAAAAVGSLNLISIAFAVLFIGIAVDFSIQFSIRYRDERHRSGDLTAAIAAAARGIGISLTLAATAAAVGFFAFVPTDYSGVSELGLIAGTSMVIALLLNFTMLPALLKLLRPHGEPEPVGFLWAARLDELLLRRRRGVVAFACFGTALGLALLPFWHFDFDPLNLKDPKTESVSTLFDLMADPSTTPYTIDILAPSVDAADALAKRLDQLPEVEQVVGVTSFVPEQQDEKLAILADTETLLGPTLSPPNIAAAPDDDATLAAIVECAGKLHAIETPGSPAARLGAALDGVARNRSPELLRAMQDDIVSGLTRRLAALRLSLSPEHVSLASLPEEQRRGWIAEDGRARLEVFPKGDARDSRTLQRFVAAVRRVAPEATGTPVTIQESGSTVLSAFITAGWIAVSAITVLLIVLLRRLLDVALVIAPLILAGLLTAATSVLVGLPLNYANIITLPLLLGIGVAFDIYFVVRWRNGEAGPLQSSTARAVLFSALTTTTAFGSLALSAHPGTAEMGRLLTIALFYVLFCTFVILPALLGPVRGAAPAARSGAGLRQPARQEDPAGRE